MNKKVLLITIGVSLLLFFVLMNVASLYMTFLMKVLNCSESQYIFLESKSKQEFFIYYPKYGGAIFTIIKLSKLIALFFIGIVVVVVSKIYQRKWIPQKQLFLSFGIIMLLLFSELILSVANYKQWVGLSWGGRIIGEDLTLLQQQDVDKRGMIFFRKETEKILPNYNINNQGFRSKYNFDIPTSRALKDTSHLIMFVGDSHTEGCCANPINKSFVDLIDQQKGLSVFNFGTGGTDPLQYKLVIDKYLKPLTPDLLIVPLCLGNDFMQTKRIPNSKLPLCFQTNFDWINTTLPMSHPEYRPDTYFDNWQEARSFYLKYYTVCGSRTSTFEKYVIKPSSIVSLLYYFPRGFEKLNNRKKALNSFTPISLEESRITYNYLKEIKSMCDSLEVDFLLVGIPTIKDIGKNKEQLDAFYRRMLEDLVIHIPTNIKEEDFVNQINDHFVNSGHQKFASFLLPVIDSILTYQTFSNSSLEN